VNEDELREQATKRLEGQRAFKVMLGIFAISLLAMVVVWWLVGGGYFWPGWAMFGMGITVLIFGWVAYGPRTGPIPESQVDKEVRKMTGE